MTVDAATATPAAGRPRAGPKKKTWWQHGLFWFAIVAIGGVILSSAVFVLTSQTSYSTLGGPIGSRLHLAGFDPWTGQPYTSSIWGFDGELVRVEPLPEAFVGHRAIPVPVAFVVGGVTTLAALMIFRPAKVVMAATVALLAPIAAVPIVIFSSYQTPCPEGADRTVDAVALCGSRVLEEINPNVWEATVAAFGIAWFAMTVALVIYVARIDPGRLLRSSAVAAIVAFLAASAGFVMGTGLLEGATPRLRFGAQIGMQSGIAVLIIGMVVKIARAAIMARPTREH